MTSTGPRGPEEISVGIQCSPTGVAYSCLGASGANKPLESSESPKDKVVGSTRSGLPIRLHEIVPFANLSGADLSYADLSFTNLACVNLSGANLAHTNLRSTYLSGANLSNVNLCGANLVCATLSGADLTGTFLSGADLFSCVMGDWERDSTGYAKRKTQSASAETTEPQKPTTTPMEEKPVTKKLLHTLGDALPGDRVKICLSNGKTTCDNNTERYSYATVVSQNKRHCILAWSKNANDVPMNVSNSRETAYKMICDGDRISDDYFAYEHYISLIPSLLCEIQPQQAPAQTNANEAIVKFGKVFISSDGDSLRIEAPGGIVLTNGTGSFVSLAGKNAGIEWGQEDESQTDDGSVEAKPTTDASESQPKEEPLAQTENNADTFGTAIGVGLASLLGSMISKLADTQSNAHAAIESARIKAPEHADDMHLTESSNNTASMNE